jgi:molecular chaperone DnaK
MIDRNTTIPTKQTPIFATSAENHTVDDDQIVQMARARAPDRKLLSQSRFNGIPIAPRGIPQIEVAFDIDANGILHGTAKDNGTGLSDEQIENAGKETEAHAGKIKQCRKTVAQKNQLDSFLYQSEKQSKELMPISAMENKNLSRIPSQKRKQSWLVRMQKALSPSMKGPSRSA